MAPLLKISIVLSDAIDFEFTHWKSLEVILLLFDIVISLTHYEKNNICYNRVNSLS